MMKHPATHFLLPILAAFVGTIAATAQTIDSVGTSTLSNVEFSVTNNGVIAYNPSTRTRNFTAPRGSKSQYLFGGGLWFGAQRTIGDTTQQLLFSTYNPVTNRSAATPGDAFANDTAAPPIVYHSTEYDRWSGQPLAGGNRPNWPLWLVPTQASATPLYPGVFEPANNKRAMGDYSYPAFVELADEQFTVRYHDRDLSRYEITPAAATERGYPIGLQVQQNVYAWKSGPLRNGVIVQYAITNISGQTLSECVVAQISDPDIGQRRGDDHAIFYARDLSLRACYAWSDPEPDGKLGALAMALIEAPTIQPGSPIDTASRLSYRTLGRVGCFAAWRRSDSIPYPITDLDRAALLRKQSFEPDTTAGDQVVLLGSQPFTMKPGDVAHFAVAYMVLDSVPSQTTTCGGNGTAAAGVVPELEELVREAEEVYYQKPSVVTSAAERAAVTSAAMRVFPNPTTGAAAVQFSLDRPSAIMLQIFSSFGERVAKQELPMLPAGLRTLPLPELPAGTYLLEVSSNGQRRVQLFIVE